MHALRECVELRGWWLCLNAPQSFVDAYEQHTLAYYLGATASELSDALNEARLHGGGVGNQSRCQLLRLQCWSPQATKINKGGKNVTDGKKVTFLWLGGGEGAAPWSPQQQVDDAATGLPPPRPSTARMVTRGEPTVSYRPPRYAPRYARTMGCGAMTMVFGAIWVRRDTGPCAGIVSGSWGPSVSRDSCNGAIPRVSQCVGDGAFVIHMCWAMVSHGRFVPHSARPVMSQLPERECERGSGSASAHVMRDRRAAAASSVQVAGEGVQLGRSRAAGAASARSTVDVSLCVWQRGHGARRRRSHAAIYTSRHTRYADQTESRQSA